MSNIKINSKAALQDVISELEIKLQKIKEEQESAKLECLALIQAFGITIEELVPDAIVTVTDRAAFDAINGKTPTTAKRGRPAGSKNKAKESTQESTQESAETPPQGANVESQEQPHQEETAQAPATV